MSLLNKICSYWYECIRSEDVFKNAISINVRTKAILYPFENDPFIFNKKETRIKIDNEKINNFSRFGTTDLDFYYGYPLLFYRDERATEHKDLVAPLFVIKIKFEREGLNLFLSKDETHPVCGIQALSKLGLKDEEINSINESIEDLFMGSPGIGEEELVEQALTLIKEEVDISANEEINPFQLSNSERLTTGTSAGLYNKSLIFAGVTTGFNTTLMPDLLALKSKSDIEKTALSIFDTPHISEAVKVTQPILPFPSNEYQIAAMNDVFRQTLSVIKGPPGTGKSQFISNLIVNLFWAKKSVLFVSHTNEAVEVVNKKINEQFHNLMLRTGNKEISQQLVGKFGDLQAEYTRRNNKSQSDEYVRSLWQSITEYRKSLLVRDELEKNYQQKYHLQNEWRKLIKVQSSIVEKVKIGIKLLISIVKSKRIHSILHKYPRRIELERQIKEQEKKYYEACGDLVGSVFLKKMFNDGKNTGLVNAFLNQVHNFHVHENENREFSFLNALNVLGVWSCTLKSLRRTFPLMGGVFDYVIFDEASQVDLPSAAPALYRAKRAIVVGDPMQLTHIAGITKAMDREIAKNQGLLEMENIYPIKIRYCDTSLYKAAESSLDHPPILLTKHYRSEDQIISLCNQAFYENQLKIMTTLDYSKFPVDLPSGIDWKDIEGVVERTPGGSRINQLEVDQVFEIFKEVWNKTVGTNISIGIVTPYNGQKDAISQKISSILTAEDLEKRVRILTAHKFQGSEADIIIFSLVISSRGNGNGDKWYNIHPQILNVALSRARYLLYIVGDKKYCENRSGVLVRIVKAYKNIKNEEELEKTSLHAQFDTPTERLFFEELQKVDLENKGYKLVSKKVVKRYTLDFAIIGNKKIDIEIDGMQHEIIGGLPVLEDVERDEFLKKEGWKTLRFPNHRVLKEMPKIIQELLLELN